MPRNPANNAQMQHCERETKRLELATQKCLPDTAFKQLLLLGWLYHDIRIVYPALSNQPFHYTLYIPHSLLLPSHLPPLKSLHTTRCVC